MKFLGKMRGSGTVASADGTIGPADYELDGYVVKPGSIIASGELRMASEALAQAHLGQGVRLMTADGRAFPLRFTGKPSDRLGRIAHVDIHQGLPAAEQWRR